MDENLRHTQSHIDSVAKQEQEFLEQRTLSERAGDAVAGVAGSIFFVIVHCFLLFSWIAVNGSVTHWIRPFDPYPFPLLGVRPRIAF